MGEEEGKGGKELDSSKGRKGNRSGVRGKGGHVLGVWGWEIWRNFFREYLGVGKFKRFFKGIFGG